jgi:predicted RNA-binding protein Jag
MMCIMSEEWIEVEGADLAQALENACSELGLTREDLDYEIDLNHYKGGASTARIFAGRRDPRAARLRGEIEDRLKKLLEAQNLDVQVSVRVTPYTVQIELRAPAPGVSDEPFRAFAATLEKDLAEYIDGRDLRVSLRGFSAGDRFENPRRERRGRPDNDSRRYGRGPRISHPDDRDERDENLRARARREIKRVMNGDGPASLDDLNSYERRLVHIVVREFEGVVSHSVGDGIRKKVVIDRSDPED